MSLFVYDEGYLLSDKRKCFSNLIVPSGIRFGDPDTITDSQVKIKLVTKEDAMPTLNYSAMKAYGFYGPDVLLATLISTIKEVGLNNKSLDLLFVDTEDFTGQLIPFGIVCLFENGTLLHLCGTPVYHPYADTTRMINKKILIRVDKCSAKDTVIINTDPGVAANLCLMRKIIKKLPSQDTSRLAESIFLMNAYFDPYASMCYSVYGLKENHLFETVCRDSDDIDGFISVLNENVDLRFNKR